MESLLGNLQGTRDGRGLPESDWKSAGLTARTGQTSYVSEPFWAHTSGTHPNRVLCRPQKDTLPFVTQVVHMNKLRPPSKTVNYVGVRAVTITVPASMPVDGFGAQE